MLHALTLGRLKKIKSGAHTTNPGFSSTPGVLIVPTQFNETVYNAESGTATIGLGQVWDPVYAELQKYNVTVPGVRSPGVGVGGYITGGGARLSCSWAAILFH